MFKNFFDDIKVGDVVEIYSVNFGLIIVTVEYVSDERFGYSYQGSKFWAYIDDIERIVERK